MHATSTTTDPFFPFLAGATFISFSGIWVAWAGLDPTVSAFYRVFFGTIFLLAGCLWKKEFYRLAPRTLFLLVLSSLAFAADLVCWHASITYIGPGLSTIIGNFQVFILTFISIAFFGQRPTARFLISVPLAIFGLFLIIGFDWSTLSETYVLGIFLALLTALFYSIFILAMRHVQVIQPHVSSVYNLMIVSGLTSFLLIPAVLIAEVTFAIPTLHSFGALIGLALFSQTIGWILIATNLPRVIPSIAGLLLLLQPALAFVWDVLLFNRYTTLLNWGGVVVVLAAIYLGMSSSRQAD